MQSSPAFQLRGRAATASGAYFDVCAGDEQRVIGTLLVGARGLADRLEVIHPAFFYRIDGEIDGARERALLAWLSDSQSLNRALAQAGARAVRHVAWTESVCVSNKLP